MDMNRVFSEILVTSAKEVYLEIPLKESVNELNEVVIRARTNKEEADGIRWLPLERRMLECGRSEPLCGGLTTLPVGIFLCGWPHCISK